MRIGKSSLPRSLTLAPLLVVGSLTGSLAFSAAPALAVFPEAPVTEAPTGVTGTTATFKGELNHGAASENVAYHFAYSPGVGATCTESGLTAPVEAPFPEAMGNHKKVSLPATGLEGSSKYTVCLIAANPLEPAEATTGTSEVFTTLAAKPIVTAQSASGETPFAVTLNAEVNPENQPTTSCKFEYGTTTAYGKSATCNPEVLEGPSVEATSAQLTGLTTATTYHYRVAVKNATGEIKGTDGEFTTLPAAPPTIEGENALAQSASATLEATINPQYQEAAYKFEYSTEASGEPLALKGPVTTVNGSSSIPKEASPGQLVSVATGAVLAPGTTYFYRVVATNEKAEKGEGEVKSFTTVATPTTDEVKAVTTTFAQFNGHLTPLNPSVTTQYHFNYNLGGGACTGESRTPAKEAGTGPGSEVAASVGVSTLQPGHEYTVCLVTSNASGSAEGAPVHFTTAAALPRILTLTNSTPTPGEATLEGVINPNNQETTYVFEYASSEAALLKSEGTQFPGPSALPAEFAEVPVTQALSGLTPDTMYFYRLTAKNTKGETTEATNRFSTQGPPLVSTGEAQNVTSIAATLTGTVYPGGLLTTYTFLYVPASEYEPLAANPYARGVSYQASAGPDSTTHPIFAVLAGLQPGTTYDYTIVASNEQGGPVTGTNQTFTTPATPSTLIPPTALPVVVSPPPPPPGVAFPLLAHHSIAQLDATEAKEGKAVNPQRTLTSAEKLSKALKGCHSKKGARRTKCEKRAKKQFGAAKKKGK